jgi:Icc-related predicted phosphoesterase
MKMYLKSDIHLEFGQLEVRNDDQADVLILSGDIIVASGLMDKDSVDIPGIRSHSSRYHEFFQDCCSKFKYVLYVMGNHEHYNGDFAKTYNILKERLGYLPNLHILDKEFVEIGGIVFYGATFWTDMNKEDPHTLYSISGVMNDFRIINNSNRECFDRSGTQKIIPRLTPDDVVEDHKEALLKLSELIENRPNDKVVVIGHHAPSKLSTHPRYKDEVIVNGAYSSDLSEFIINRPQIALWTHGHTHHKFDYMIGDTRIVCNPRGYINYEPEASNFEPQLLEI